MYAFTNINVGIAVKRLILLLIQQYYSQ
jgi:hypothetical protein